MGKKLLDTSSRKNICFVILFIALLFTFILPYGLGSVYADDVDEPPTYNMNVGDAPVQINEESVIFFNPQKSNGYSINLSELSENDYCRVTIYEFHNAIDEDDYDRWDFVYYEDFNYVTGCLNFYGEKNCRYKITIEVTYSVKISIDEANGKAGIQNGLVWSAFEKADDYDGSIYTAVMIIGYKGNDKSVVIPQKINGYNVVYISDRVFEGAQMESISISEGVLSFGNWVFSGCQNLKTISLPSTLECLANAFTGCTSLESVTFPNGHDEYYVKNHEIRSKSGTLLYVFGLKQDEYTVSDDIIYMEPYALNDIGAKKLTISKRVISLWQLPSDVLEIHIRNANCTEDYAGFPMYYDEDENEWHYAHVYGPSGGKLEAYCNENGIPFTEEGGKYNPLDPEPFFEPINLSYGVRENICFESGRGNCQEYIIEPEETKIYSVLVKEPIESIESENDYITVRRLYDEDGYVVEPLNSVDCFIGTSYDKCISYQYNLTKGKKYTFVIKIINDFITENYCKYISVLFTNRYKFEVDPNGGYYEVEEYNEDLDDYIWSKKYDPVVKYYYMCVNNVYIWELYGDQSIEDIFNYIGEPYNDDEELSLYGYSFNGSNITTDYSGIELKGDTKVIANWGEVIPTPIVEPTETPAKTPSAAPTKAPTVTPVNTPSAKPTAEPTKEPTAVPAKTPTVAPSTKPTKIDAKLPKAKSLKAKNMKSKKLVVSWKKLKSKELKKINGFEIQYSTDKSFNNSVVTKSVNKKKKSYTIKKLKKKATYYVRIRTYKTYSGERVYSNWSTVKKVKIKK